MRAVILAVVALMVVGLGGTLDYSLAAKVAGAGYGFGEHLLARTAFVRNFLPQGDLARALPAAPYGWTVREGRGEDSFTVTGLPVDPALLASSQALDTTLAGSIKGLQVERRMYENGAQAVYLDVTVVPAAAMNTSGAQTMAQLFSSLTAQAEPPAEADSFATHRLSLPEFGAASLYLAVVEGQIFISALSSAEEGVTRDLLHGIDRAALRQMLADDPTMGEEPVAGDPVAAAVTPEKPAPCATRGAAKFCGIGG